MAKSMAVYVMGCNDRLDDIKKLDACSEQPNEKRVPQHLAKPTREPFTERRENYYMAQVVLSVVRKVFWPR